MIFMIPLATCPLELGYAPWPVEAIAVEFAVLLPLAQDGVSDASVHGQPRHMAVLLSYATNVENV